MKRADVELNCSLTCVAWRRDLAARLNASRKRIFPNEGKIYIFIQDDVSNRTTMEILTIIRDTIQF